ncbi:hypothetical protein ACKI10_17390 [Streptomyces galilaeus]|uniref:Uncharacterized protein n=1 Tax=Streptomyces galilaeus TaxID=33899 RepID=A0ABW9IMU7_STRGJ
MSNEQMPPEQYRAAAERLLGLPASEFRQEFQAWCDALREDEFTRTAEYRHRTVTRRAWLQDDDGTYYRNCPMIMAEQDRLINMLLPWRLRALDREWWHVYREGVLRTRTIGRFDRVATAAPLRETYPDNPGLRVLDEEPT